MNVLVHSEGKAKKEKKKKKTVHEISGLLFGWAVSYRGSAATGRDIIDTDMLTVPPDNLRYASYTRPGFSL